ncbi:hypothetical protein MLD38_023612 [Melastoma candidum]|uniref:Uncharacterized protein n=1 Tax=Melastoma candidum TaxID=119954 RepID=A0ACB9NSL8_9MYRT|nr:hypothetical protein MLD38_023612 [Melastoma candidum]
MQDDQSRLASWRTNCTGKEEGNETVCHTDFFNGMKVEVRSDEDGFQGSWFAAVIVGAAGNNKYLVEYETLKTDDGSQFLREEQDASYIRPVPPTIQRMYPFSRLEAVDVWYSEGWWIGYISQILDNWNYIVYFRTTNEEMVFNHTDLRPHQEWVGGQWLSAGKEHLAV